MKTIKEKYQLEDLNGQDFPGNVVGILSRCLAVNVANLNYVEVKKLDDGQVTEFKVVYKPKDCPK